jgi:hypothetical protein
MEGRPTFHLIFGRFFFNILNYLKLYRKDFQAIDTVPFRAISFISANDNGPSVPKNSPRGKG